MKKLFALCFLAAASCSPNLGSAPFLCSKAGQCPDGYECNAARVCIKSGECPTGVAGCEEAKCGDNICTGTETCDTCAKDCGKCDEAHCGDEKCSKDETCTSCVKDCGPCKTGCGDGNCGKDESCKTCEEDCGKCTATCGDGKCDDGESCETCKADCKCAECGDGQCTGDETIASCPDDCKEECTEGQTNCDDDKTLSYCEDGTRKTDTCENICLEQYDYSVACRVSNQTGKHTCICGNYAGFGELCNDEILCETSMFCGAFGQTATNGFCTKYCSNPGGMCSGAPQGTSAQCSLNVGGQDVCGFLCDYLTSCPTDMNCDTYEGVCKP